MKEDRWWLFLQSNLYGFDEMKYSKAFLLRQPNNVAANERLPHPYAGTFLLAPLKTGIRTLNSLHFAVRAQQEFRSVSLMVRN